MDPKVWGKLLTLHRRGYGVDVEALRDRCPLRRSSGTAPRWDLTGTEGCGGGIRFSWMPLLVWGYIRIYRRKKYIGGATWAPRGWRACPGGRRAPYLVPSWLLSWRRVQVLWITFVPKITFPKVSFRLDSVWYSFSAKHWNKGKNRNWHWALG